MGWEKVLEEEVRWQKNEQTKTCKYAFFSDFTVVARKGSSQVSLRNRSKKGEPEYIKSRAKKTFRKHQKIIADDEHDTSQINDFHAFKQLLFIYFYNLICLLILAMLGLPC